MKRRLRTKFEAGRGYSKQDWDEVSDNPEWTEEDFKNAKPFAPSHWPTRTRGMGPS